MKAEVKITEYDYTYLISMKHLGEYKDLFDFDIYKIQDGKINFGLIRNCENKLYFSDVLILDVPFNHMLYTIIQLPRDLDTQYFLCIKSSRVYSGNIISEQTIEFDERKM